ncbi:N-acetylglucosaminyl deacetylase, LmbE family [Dyella sp. OK004]|uniref:PIG-L deacetylase family protein n=1 Tax=Dyella sp. OK004 TaxID=1855292 RepID=UPI0008DF4DF2|nr:PIG-L family deacetylase [Dyella sp. OK004]SFS12620.1 N-acetylglucosaminyl deacetylase, LmbE family [Dyella sp. OK004]
MSLRLDAQTRLLVIAPHPDDESIATGELIQHVRAAGGAANILLLTDGDNNPWPQRWLERRLRIGAAERERWGLRRRGEVELALRQLGLPQEAMHALGLPDMGVTRTLRSDLPGMLRHWTARLDAFRPNLIVFPALADRHPDHSAAHVLTRLAVAQWEGGSSRLLSYLVHGHAEDQGALVQLETSADIHGNKLDALRQHHSQMALSGARMHRLADRPEHYREMGIARQSLPWQPSSVLWPWLKLTVADRGGVHSWSLGDAPLERDRAGQYVLRLPAPEGPRFAKLHMDLPSPWIFDRWGWCEL